MLPMGFYSKIYVFLNLKSITRHMEIVYDNVKVPKENIILGEGNNKIFINIFFIYFKRKRI